MTRIERIDMGAIIEIRVEGHSHGGSNGVDLVCAACSALACALAGMPGAVWRKGEASLRVVLPGSRKAREWIRVILRGYEMLEKQYPKNVRVIR